MPYHLQIVPSREFVRTNANGEFDLEGTKELLLSVFSKMKDLDLSEVVLDVREAYSKMTALALLQLLPILDRVGHKGSWNIAILYRPKNRFDRAKFFELCAQNKGYQVAPFKCLKKPWLGCIPIRRFEPRFLFKLHWSNDIKGVRNNLSPCPVS